MEWDNQMTNIQTIDQVHVRPMDEEDGIGWSDGGGGGIQTIEQVHVRPGDGWRRWDRMVRLGLLKQSSKFTYYLETDEEVGIGWSDEGIQIIEQLHVRPGDGWRGRDKMIRLGLFKQLSKFTYALETDEDGGIGWSDKNNFNNCPTSRTVWRRMTRLR